MSDDTGTPAVEEPKPAFSKEQEAFMNTMLEKQSEQLTSHFGRIVTKQMEEKFMPEIKKNQVDPKQFEEIVQGKGFGGDMVGAINEVIDMREKNASDLQKAKEEAITEEMEKFKDQPFFQETEAQIKEIAIAAIKKGHPPAPAVELAYEKAGRIFLQNKDPEYKLSMSRGGKQAPRKKEAKLPAAFKTQAAKDIANGIFKDEADYIANLSPSIREKHGI